MYLMVSIQESTNQQKVPEEFKKQVLGDKDYKFVLFWMNRNIKQPSDVIWKYSNNLEKDCKKDRDDVCLIMHTNLPVDNNGTDLFSSSKRLHQIVILSSLLIE